jgi:hypothetical protein
VVAANGRIKVEIQDKASGKAATRVVVMIAKTKVWMAAARAKVRLKAGVSGRVKLRVAVRIRVPTQALILVDSAKVNRVELREEVSVKAVAVRDKRQGAEKTRIRTREGRAVRAGSFGTERLLGQWI